MEFFASAVDTLKVLVMAIGWGGGGGAIAAAASVRGVSSTCWKVTVPTTLQARARA